MPAGKREALTEDKIQEYLHGFHPILSSPKYEAFNIFLFGWESDYLAFSRSGYIYEAEIKVSRPDFLRDVRGKRDKHRALARAMRGDQTSPAPNYFLYVCPEGVILPEDLADMPYAGLLYVSPDGHFDRLHLQRPMIHPAKCPFPEAVLAEKFHWAMINMAKRYWNKEVTDISPATRARYDNLIMEYDEMLSERTQKIDELEKKLKMLTKPNKISNEHP